MDALDAAFAELGKSWDGLDFIVHAIGFSDKNELRGKFVDTTHRQFPDDHEHLGLFVSSRSPSARRG